MPASIQTKAAVLFISGQSNAHAHGQFLPEADRIYTPMKNVFSLDRNPNQSFDITDVVWSGYTTAGKNLGELQDHTACLAYHFAKLWQGAIDAGEALPDLYIVQISIGSQGLINGMWNRDKEKVMRPGKPGETGDISLLPWAVYVNRLVMENLKKSGKSPAVIGWHWIGSEQEVWFEAFNRPDLQERYDYFFDTILDSIGQKCPTYLYKPNVKNFCQTHDIALDAEDKIASALRQQIYRHPHVQMVDAANYPLWDASSPLRGIFAKDEAHYLPEVQKWFADQFYNEVRSRYSFE